MSPVPEAPSSNTFHSSLAMRRATARFQSAVDAEAEDIAQQVVARSDTAEQRRLCCQANSAAFSRGRRLRGHARSLLHDLVGAAVDALHARVGEQPARSGIRSCSRSRRAAARTRRAPAAACRCTTTWPSTRSRCRACRRRDPSTQRSDEHARDARDAGRARPA